jgi:hypothetical protein
MQELAKNNTNPSAASGLLGLYFRNVRLKNVRLFIPDTEVSFQITVILHYWNKRSKNLKLSLNQARFSHQK